MTKKYDVVIVGGGAAGLTCAWRLSEKTDAGIALLEEKESIGRNVTPGTLNMGFVDRLKRWGFSKAIERTYTRLGLYTADESAKFDLGGKPIGASINYGKFCRLLAKKSGADIFTGTKAGKLERTSYGIRINDEFEAKVMIDASGAGLLAQKNMNARLPRKYFISRGARCPSNGHDPLEMSLILDSPHGTGGGWFYPLSGKMASCGIAFLENSPSFGSIFVDKSFQKMKKSFGPFCNFVKDGTTWAEQGIIPVEPARNISSDGIMLVGDAAGQAFPLLGEGFRPTVEGAIVCSDVVAQCHTSNDFSPGRLKQYELGWNRINRKRYVRELAIRDVAFGRSSNEWNNFVRKIKNMDPEIMIRFVSGELENRTAIRKNFPMKEALKYISRYLYYKIFQG